MSIIMQAEAQTHADKLDELIKAVRAFSVHTENMDDILITFSPSR